MPERPAFPTARDLLRLGDRVIIGFIKVVSTTQDARCLHGLPVGMELRAGVGVAIGGFGEGEGYSGVFYGLPVNGALVVGDVDSLEGNGWHRYSFGGYSAIYCSEAKLN